MKITAKGNKNEFLLYGQIVPGDSRMLVSVLNSFKQGSSVTGRINSPGGDVFEGIAMFNSLKTCGLNITMQVDGIAASMASGLLVAGKKATGNKYCKIMTHQAKAEMSGDAEDMRNAAKLIDEFNNDIASIYATKTKKTKEECMKLFMVKGKDNWMNAQEAKNAGLLDEIIDEGGIASVLAMTDKQDAILLFNEYDKFLTNNNSEKMKIVATFLGLTPEATEAQVLEAIKAKDSKITTLEGEKSSLTSTVADYQKKEGEARNASIKAMIDQAVADKKVTESQRAVYTKLATSNFDETKAAIDAMPAIGSVTSMLGKQGSDEARKDWTWDDYHKKDPIALESMMVNDKARFEALKKAKYGR